MYIYIYLYVQENKYDPFGRNSEMKTDNSDIVLTKAINNVSMIILQPHIPIDVPTQYLVNYTRFFLY